MLLGSVSSQQRFGVMNIKVLGVSQLSGLGRTMLQLSGLEQIVLQLLDKSVLPLCVTALLYLEKSRKIHPRGMRACRPKDEKRRAPQRSGGRERERPLSLWFLFLYVFSSPPGLPYVNWGRSGVELFVLPEVLTPVLGPSFVLFLRAFPFLVFQPLPFQTPISYSNYLTQSTHLLASAISLFHSYLKNTVNSYIPFHSIASVCPRGGTALSDGCPARNNKETKIYILFIES